MKIDELVQLQTNGFSIAIDKRFQIDNTVHNYFPISRKRVYLSILDKVVNDLKFVFTNYEEFIDRYIEIKMDVDESEACSNEEDFICYIENNIIKDEKLQKLIHDHVNSQYTITIENNSNGNEELQFKDSYAKLLICSSMMCRIILPFICTFMERHDIKKEQDFTVRTFTGIFKVFNTDDNGDFVDLPSKITCFITSAVDNTLYSDKIIWKFLESLSINDRTLQMDLFRKVIRDTLPKLDINRSVVSFLHVVIKQQIIFTFTQNVKINFRPITQIRTENSDGAMSQFTRVEMRLVAADEMSYLMDKETIHGIVSKLKSKYTKKEFDYFLKNIVSNPIQVRLVSSHVNSQDRVNLMLCNREEYIYMLMSAYEWFSTKGFPHLAALVIAKIAPKEDQPPPRKGFARSKIISEVIQSRSYKTIIDRFALVSGRLEESKTIVSIIGDVVSTRFIPMPIIGMTITKEQIDTVDTVLNQRKIVSELLSFFERF